MFADLNEPFNRCTRVHGDGEELNNKSGDVIGILSAIGPTLLWSITNIKHGTNIHVHATVRCILDLSV